MSKVLRQVFDAPTVFIGERNRDTEAEQRAVEMLNREFPEISYITAPDGAKFIPIGEVPSLLAAVRQRVELAGRQARQQGYQAGVEKGLEEARKVLEQFQGAIADVVNQRQVLLDEARERILNLVLQISRKVTFDAIEADREATVTMINNIVNQLTDRSRLRIKVHPDFLPIVEAGMARFLEGATDIKDLAFEADTRVKFGGCLIETPSGDIDARIESQFDVIAGILNSNEEA